MEIHQVLRNDPRQSLRTWLIDMASLTCFILIFYFLWLGTYPLFTPDEGRYVGAASEMIARGDYITPRVNGIPFLEKPILYYWLQVLALHLFGAKEFIARLFPALFGLLGSLLTYFCGRQLFNRRIGLLSALILASSPLYFTSAHYANLDLEVAVFISASLLFFITALKTVSKWRPYYFLIAYTAGSLAFLTKGLIGIAFPIMIIGLWTLLLSRFDIFKKIYILPGILLALIITLPWCLVVQKNNPDFLHYFFITQHISRYLSNGTFNNPAPPWFYVPVVMLGFLPWSAFLVQTLYRNIMLCWRNAKAHETSLFLLIWIFSIFIFFSIPHSKIVTYLLPIFPALSLLVSSYLVEAWDDPHRKGIYYGHIGFIGIGLLLAFTLIVASELTWFNFTTDFLSSLTLIAVIIIITIILSALGIMVFKTKSMTMYFCVYLCCSVFSLLSLVHGAKYLNQNSAKSLVIGLKTIVNPSDEVVSYFNYYYDVPFYLGKEITVVGNWHSPTISHKDNWLRELSFGMDYLKKDSLLIDESSFWNRFKSSKRIFVFVNSNYLMHFKEKKIQYYLIGTSFDINLISNQPGIQAT